jgi:type I restriction-modification system DNA methylase subunit
MALSLNKPKLDNLAAEIWKSAERLRGKFKAYEYQNVVLPIIVIRRLERVLIKWREEKAAEVLSKRPKLTEKELANLVKGLETSTAPFSNKTDWTLRKVYEEDHTLLAENFRAYINGFSKNVGDIIEHFNYRAKTSTERANVEKFVTVHGQEMSPTNYAICQADLLIKDDRQAKVHLGNSLIPHDPHSREPGDQLPENKFRFDFMLSNPPFGVTWGGKEGYEAEALLKGLAQ